MRPGLIGVGQPSHSTLIDGGRGYSAPVHTAEEISAFLDGETRLVAAAHRVDSTAPLFVLPDGSAREHRAWTKSELRCFIPDCPAPDLTTVSRRRGRDGFRHLTRGAGGHSPESFHHIQGKAVIAAWLSCTYPSARVTVEAATDSQRSQIADVMLVIGDVRYAFEVQYAPLSPDEWEARHRSYQGAGIVDVWLWGHTPRQLKKGRHDRLEGKFHLTPAQEALRDQGLQLLWINPELGRIGTATETAWILEESLRIQANGVRFDLLFEDLADLRIDEGGVTSPTLGRLAVSGRRVREYRDAEDARIAREEQFRRERQKAAIAELVRRSAEVDEQHRMRRERDAATRRALAPRSKESAPGSRRDQLERKIADREAQRARAAGEPLRDSTSSAASIAVPSPLERTLCLRCGREIDPILISGYHVTCAPGWLPHPSQWQPQLPSLF